MKKRTPIFLGIAILLIFCTAVTLNRETGTKRCVDYDCQEAKLPLYLKLLDFFDRHCNYKHLVKKIAGDSDNESERVIKILKWTYENIKKNPKELPVVDDHVWYIIVRGYGASDQFSDVFSTLCNYAGFDSFFNTLKNEYGAGKECFSFVKLKRGWAVFDVYEGVYFENKQKQICTKEELLNGNWQAVSIGKDGVLYDYAKYFKNLGFINLRDYKLLRSAIQSPLRRLIFWTKRNK